MKVGSYDVPNTRLGKTLLNATKKIYDTYKSEEATNQLAVANLLGHKSERSGAYLQKIADLRSYGLIEKRGIKITETGKKITYGRESEKLVARKSAVLNIPLWNVFYDTWGLNPPETDFWAHLERITGMEAPDAHAKEQEILSAYLIDVKELTELSDTEDKPIPTILEVPSEELVAHQSIPILKDSITNEKRELIVNINIQVALPEKGDPEQYDKIFAALKKHFFTE